MTNMILPCACFDDIMYTFKFVLGVHLCDEDYFMAIALLSAERSKDPVRQASRVVTLLVLTFSSRSVLPS